MARRSPICKIICAKDNDFEAFRINHFDSMSRSSNSVTRGSSYESKRDGAGGPDIEPTRIRGFGSRIVRLKVTINQKKRPHLGFLIDLTFINNLKPSVE